MTDSTNMSVPSPVERRIGLVTPDQELSREIQLEASRLQYRVVAAGSLSELDDSTAKEILDVVLIDLDLIRADAERTLRRFTSGGDAPAVILIARPDAHPPSPYDLLEHGVADVLHLPFHRAQLRLRLTRVLETRDVGTHMAGLEQAINERSRRSFTDRTLIAESAAMRQLSTTLGRVAPLRTTVLVLGESGVGKELVARTLHFRSPRHDAPFIAINCAALPQHLIESDLFGHERGAFTGAVNRRAGKFELAHRGTLFLDEIGETDLPTQAKLLRVLEHQEFMRVGGSRPVKVDVRLIAATNADLERLVREGRFREDLYYRLKVVTLTVPPLRERKEDLPTLAEQFVASICRANSLRPRRLTPDTIAALVRYAWPGNVREMVNTLEAVIVSTPSELIDVEHLPLNIQGRVIRENPRLTAIAGQSLRDLEVDAIRSTLASCGGSRTRAAELLGIGVRTLRRRIRELGLDEQMPPKPGRPRSNKSS